MVACLEVGCRVGASTGVVILVEVLLEGRRPGSVLGFVAESCAGARHEIVVVFLNTCLALLHTPEDESDAAEEQSAADAADNTTNDLLVGFTNTAPSSVVVALLCCRRVGDDGLSSGGGQRPGTS